MPDLAISLPVPLQHGLQSLYHSDNIFQHLLIDANIYLLYTFSACDCHSRERKAVYVEVTVPDQDAPNCSWNRQHLLKPLLCHPIHQRNICFTDARNSIAGVHFTDFIGIKRSEGKVEARTMVFGVKQTWTLISTLP